MSLPFCTITPTRGDRPQFLEFCKHQLNRMSIKPAHSYFIDNPPVSKGFDLTWRVVEGIRQAMQDGFSRFYIIEDDDYYSPFYFNKMTFSKEPFEFVGTQRTVYYSIRTQRYTEISHPKRSSLFCTAFKSSSVASVEWPAGHERFLDLVLWKQARHKTFRDEPGFIPAVGIKHGIGLCGGKGHTMHHENDDSGLEWLKRNVDAEAFDFYIGVMKQNGWA